MATSKRRKAGASTEASGAPPITKGQRADARRNREKVVEAAARMFATEGLGVSVHAVARRAGVGTGTVSRHFPTKEALLQAIIGSRAAPLAAEARRILEERDPGDAFLVFFGVLLDAGAENRGLADAVAGAGFDADSLAAASGHDLAGPFRELLTRAQRAGTVRADLQFADVKALLAGCLARERSGVDATARRRMLEVVAAGIRQPVRRNGRAAGRQ